MFVMTQYVTLFVISAGIVFTMITVHLLIVKNVVLTSMALPDIATNSNAGCTKPNRMTKKNDSPGDTHRLIFGRFFAAFLVWNLHTILDFMVFLVKTKGCSPLQVNTPKTLILCGFSLI